ncbi:MAG: hypothetical protein AAF675_14525 [Pseudomonadota bacterium]
MTDIMSPLLLPAADLRQLLSNNQNMVSQRQQKKSCKTIQEGLFDVLS